MGQYHLVVNISKKEFLNPHKFNEGIKLLEFGMSAQGTMTALAVLLSNSPNRGGGDLRTDDLEYYGRWAADRIVIAGDYAEKADPGEPPKTKANLYELCRIGKSYKDISEEVIKVFKEAGEDIGHNE